MIEDDAWTDLGSVASWWGDKDKQAFFSWTVFQLCLLSVHDRLGLVVNVQRGRRMSRLAVIAHFSQVPTTSMRCTLFIGISIMFEINVIS